ncbi:hypothetical protein BKA69DRAFT_585677 [Paraphysoderma sedebokerense]|nr:hypothetical protein BKA69DRAFT_585677 [Paraphysoderma sedebokerense]
MPLKRIRALYSYSAQQDDQLSFSKHQEFFILSRKQDWFFASTNASAPFSRTAKVGLVPANYFVVVDDDAVEPVPLQRSHSRSGTRESIDNGYGRRISNAADDRERDRYDYRSQPEPESPSFSDSERFVQSPTDYKPASRTRPPNSPSPSNSTASSSTLSNGSAGLKGRVLIRCMGGSVALKASAGEEVTVEAFLPHKNCYKCRNAYGESGLIRVDKVEVYDNSDMIMNVEDVEVALATVSMDSVSIHAADSDEDDRYSDTRSSRSAPTYADRERFNTYDMASDSGIQYRVQRSNSNPSPLRGPGLLRTSSMDRMPPRRRGSAPLTPSPSMISASRQPTLTRRVPQHVLDEKLYGARSPQTASDGSSSISTPRVLATSSFETRAIQDIKVLNCRRAKAGHYSFTLTITPTRGSSREVTRCCHSFYNLLEALNNRLPSLSLSLPPMLTASIENNYKQICILPAVVKQRTKEFEGFCKDVLNSQDFAGGSTILEAWCDPSKDGQEDLAEYVDKVIATQSLSRRNEGRNNSLSRTPRMIYA